MAYPLEPLLDPECFCQQVDWRHIWLRQRKLRLWLMVGLIVLWVLYLSRTLDVLIFLAAGSVLLLPILIGFWRSQVTMNGSENVPVNHLHLVDNHSGMPLEFWLAGTLLSTVVRNLTLSLVLPTPLTLLSILSFMLLITWKIVTTVKTSHGSYWTNKSIKNKILSSIRNADDDLKNLI